MTRGLLTCCFWTTVTLAWVLWTLLALALECTWEVVSFFFSIFGWWQTLLLIPIVFCVFCTGMLACFVFYKPLYRAICHVNPTFWVGRTVARFVLARL